MTKLQHLNFEESLTASLTTATKEAGRFDSSAFFKDWCFRRGKGFFFLFKKNLHVTNIQFAELIALIRLHTTFATGVPVKDLQFVSTTFFRQWVETIVNTLTPLNGKPKFDALARLYGELFQRTIVVDSFYTSCSVFLPPALELDLLAVCAYSGYIHSCGSNVFVRKVNKTSKEHLIEALWSYLDVLENEGKKVFFTVYSHEDFTQYDRELGDELRDGLDDVKIYMEKFFMGRDSLVSVFREIRTLFARHLEIPEPGNFRIKHKDFRELPNVDATRTLWLIKDYGIEPNSLRKTSEPFFICYDQQYVNDNHFHIFDENKPAWVSHTTIPHTLLGAMVNIARPYLPTSRPAILCDPFVGTGTTWLEGLKHDHLQFRCSDVSPIAALLAQDNLDFFSQSSEQLRYLCSELQRLADLVGMDPGEPELRREPQLFDTKQFRSVAYNQAFELAHAIADKIESITTDQVRQLADSKLFNRIVFYLALRTRLRNIGAFERESKDWKSAYMKEARTLLLQTQRLIHLRERQVESPVTTLGTKATNICVYQGKYSLACCPSTEVFSKAFYLCKAGNGVFEQNARKLKEKSCDLIVTDPPYGFNTNDEPAELADLWTQCLRAMILALTDGGHLVLCLPDQSHTGRDLQYFTHREFITHQVLSIAASVNKDAGLPADVVPSPTKLYRPPFYWESERALRRAILHFTFWEKGERISERLKSESPPPGASPS